MCDKAFRDIFLIKDLNFNLLTTGFVFSIFLNEPHHEKTRFLPMQKQRCRSGMQ